MNKITIDIELPDWASYDKGFFIVDPDVVYPLFLRHLKMVPTQFSLEVARRCFTQRIKNIVKIPFKLRITKNDRWKLTGYPPGGSFDEGEGQIAQEAGSRDFMKYFDLVKAL